MKKLFFFKLLLILFVSLFNAQTIDNSFGTNGRVITELSTGVDGANEVLLQPDDGKIVALGSANNRIQMAPVITTMVL